MMYCSTRGPTSPVTSPVSFEDALLAGLAPDGGLYMPESWPQFSHDQIRSFAGQPFYEVAAQVLTPFVGKTFTPEQLRSLCKSAFSSFKHNAVCPLVQVDDEDWILELFHGPTLAFKDVAMQLLGGMFETVLGRQGRKMTIIGATSGDTGGAAIEALKNKKNINVFILHPEGRISDVQRKIMTTSDADNITNIAVDGTFDDCQAIVKMLFGERDFVERVGLGGVNSINWARIAIQTVYYFTASAALGGPDRALSFVVPTGNFGDIFAGFVANKMGLPIKTLCAATNRNDIVHRVLSTGEYSPSTVSATASPSMDIQVASNFERLIFEATGRDDVEVNRLMSSQKQSGEFTLTSDAHENISNMFCSDMATEDETSLSMREHLENESMLIDPHTAVGRVVAKKIRKRGIVEGPVITLATAHPAKFPESVEAATGQKPELPSSLADLHQRKEQIILSPAEARAIKTIVLERADLA